MLPKHHNTPMTSPTITKCPCIHGQLLGGRVPVVMSNKTRYNIHGWCLHVRQVVATPANGCAHWVLQVPARVAPIIWQKGEARRNTM